MSLSADAGVAGVGPRAATTDSWARALAALFAAEWVLWAWRPWYRQDWALENLVALLTCWWLVRHHRRAPLSTASYLLLFVFGSLHEIGAHYTYAAVPYDLWFRRHAGFSLDAALGFSRNHFDRLVHFLFGLLLYFPLRELLQRGAEVRGRALAWVPVMVLSTISMIFELIEWVAAEIFGGDLGQAYLGTQGDIWDAQKDMALALAGGALSAISAVYWRRRRN